MNTAIGIEARRDRFGLAMSSIRKQMRRLAKARRTIDRKAGRIQKQLIRDAYDWSSMGS